MLQDLLGTPIEHLVVACAKQPHALEVGRLSAPNHRLQLADHLGIRDRVRCASDFGQLEAAHRLDDHRVALVERLDGTRVEEVGLARIFESYPYHNRHGGAPWQAQDMARPAGRGDAGQSAFRAKRLSAGRRSRAPEPVYTLRTLLRYGRAIY